MCKPEKTATANGDFVWEHKYDDVDFAVSKPDVCWINGSILVRQCARDNKRKYWSPNGENCEKFKRRNLKCPEDLGEVLVNGKIVCVRLSKTRQQYDSSFCQGSNYILSPNDNELIAFLLEKNVDGLWLPVERAKGNGIKPFFIRLPGFMWNTLYEIPFDKVINLSDKHCVGAFLKKTGSALTMNIEPVVCVASLYSVCVFKDELVARNGCPQNFGALGYRPSECYGLTWDGKKFPQDLRMLDADEFFEKYNELRTIFDKQGITAKTDVEVKGSFLIPNAKWTVDMNKEMLSIKPASRRTKSLCVEHVAKRKDVEIILRMDHNGGDTLVLTVYNKFYIWSLKNKVDFTLHCFAHTRYGDLLNVDINRLWENESQTKTMFELSIKHEEPTLYWCEAHTIFNFTMATSTKIVASKNKNSFNFAMQLDLPLPRNESAEWTNKSLRQFIKYFTKDIEKMLKLQKTVDSKLDELDIQSVRIMNILSGSTVRGELRVLCHITISLKSLDFKRDSSEGSESHEDDEVGESEVEAILMGRDLLKYLIQGLQQHMVHTVRSTQYCLPENHWPRASLGEISSTVKFCLQNNGLPLTRKCLGNFMEGAYWEDISHIAASCFGPTNGNAKTKELFDMYAMKISKKYPEKAMQNVREILENNIKELIPADLHYMAKIIRKTVKTVLKQYNFTTTEQCNNSLISVVEQNATPPHNMSDIISEIDRIFNYLLNVDQKILQSARVLNSTNILLDTFELIVDEIYTANLQRIYNSINVSISSVPQNNHEIDVVEFKDAGVIVKAATNFVIFAINPVIANVTGVAIFRDVDDSVERLDDNHLGGAFSDEHFRFICANQSANHLLNMENIVIGAFVPESMWYRLDEISALSNKSKIFVNRPRPSVIIKIYSNDKLFQEDEEEESLLSSVMGKIMSISIPGHDKDLPELLPIILSSDDNSENNNPQYCSYWNYKTWVKDGLTLLNRSALNNNTILCGSSHLTPFAYLLRGSNNLSVDSDVQVIVTKLHENALNIITLLGCSLSIFGVTGIFATACTFRTWRQKPNSRVLLQLSAAIALQMILFCFVNTTEYSLHLIQNEILSSCIALGALLHYSVLVQFCWMIIIAYLQFKRYVKVFGNTRPKRFFVKSTLIGWGLPVIPVFMVLLFDSSSYIPHNGDSNNPICYPSGKSLYIGVVLPISLVILANLVIFVVVIYNILKSPAGSVRHTEKNFALSQMRLLLLLFFLLGFTWIFGYIYSA